MANGYNPRTRAFSTPYLTLAEFKNAPTSLQIDNLVVGGDSNAQDAELMNAIVRASSWIDEECNQVIGATTETEHGRAVVNRRGLSFHPNFFPVIALTSLQYGSDPENLVTADCTKAWVEDRRITMPSSYIQDFNGLQVRRAPLGEIYVKYTYVVGYANTHLTVASLVGDLSITVEDGTGIVPGQSMKVPDGANTENIEVDSTYVFGSNVIPLATALTKTHAIGVAVTAFPAVLKEATILATSDFLSEWGNTALAMGVLNTPSGISVKVETQLDKARKMLKNFVRRY